MSDLRKNIAIVGAGPSGLFAAERLAGLGHCVTVFERKPSPARKFLMAGRGGLNLTHSEPHDIFTTRYRAASPWMAGAIQSFAPHDLRTWCASLGVETFIGSSGRIFPTSMKASPLLRAWLARLETLGVSVRTRHDWRGWDHCGDLVFDTPEGEKTFSAHATLLALGGASWPSLGSDGSWTRIDALASLPLSPFRPSNCGFHVSWSDHLRQKFSGCPLKNIALTFNGTTVRGEAMITHHGIEGGAVYALSAPIRDALDQNTSVSVFIDFKPLLSVGEIAAKITSSARGRKTVSAHLKSILGLSPLQIALLYEAEHELAYIKPQDMARVVKQVRIDITASFGIERAISSAGGLSLDSLDDRMQIIGKNGVFACGEMLDWEAPTGGYLLQGCFATAAKAADGINDWLSKT